MLELLGTVISSVVGGGATGLLGVLLQRWFDFKNKTQDIEILKLKHVQELEMRKQDLEMNKQEWEGRNRVAVTEGESAMGVADAEALAASYLVDKATYATGKLTRTATAWMVFVDVVRGLIRPFLTLYLVILTHVVYEKVSLMLDPSTSLTNVEKLEVLKLVIGTILYLTVTCVLWWFGTRNKSRAPG